MHRKRTLPFISLILLAAVAVLLGASGYAAQAERADAAETDAAASPYPVNMLGETYGAWPGGAAPDLFLAAGYSEQLNDYIAGYVRYSQTVWAGQAADARQEQEKHSVPLYGEDAVTVIGLAEWDAEPLALGEQGGHIYLFPTGYEYPMNQNGQTYGSAAGFTGAAEEPELTAVAAQDRESGEWVCGYCFSSELDGPELSTPEEIAAYMAQPRQDRFVPIYDADGETVLGVYTVHPSHSVEEGV